MSKKNSTSSVNKSALCGLEDRNKTKNTMSFVNPLTANRATRRMIKKIERREGKTT